MARALVALLWGPSLWGHWFRIYMSAGRLRSGGLVSVPGAAIGVLILGVHELGRHGGPGFEHLSLRTGRAHPRRSGGHHGAGRGSREQPRYCSSLMCSPKRPLFNRHHVLVAHVVVGAVIPPLEDQKDSMPLV